MISYNNRTGGVTWPLYGGAISLYSQNPLIIINLRFHTEDIRNFPLTAQKGHISVQFPVQVGRRFARIPHWVKRFTA